MSPNEDKSTTTNKKSLRNLKTTNTLAVIGLSGPETVKGSTGVGKSTLCNRLVRPHFNDFYLEHISYLSQVNFNKIKE